MTVKEAKKSVNDLKKAGYTEEEICIGMYKMFQDGRIDVDQLGALVELVGYELTDEFLEMSPEDQKTQGLVYDEEEEEIEQEDEPVVEKKDEAEEEEKKLSDDDVKKMFGIK